MRIASPRVWAASMAAAFFFALAPMASATSLAHIEVDLVSVTNNPQACDFVFTRFNVTNNGLSGMAQAGTAWITYDTPDGGTIQRRLKNTSVGVGETKNYRTKEYIPCDAAPGTYTVTVSYESSDRSTVYDSESTTFEIPGTLLRDEPVVTETAASKSLAHVEVDLVSITNAPQCDDFVFTRFNVTNNGLSGMAQAGTAWVTYSTPDGGMISRRIQNTAVAVGQTKNFRVKEFIPCDAAPGTYTVTVSFESGDRTTVYDSESTSFTIGGTGMLAEATPAPTSASKSLAHIEVDLGSITNNPQRGDFLFVRFNVTNNGATGMAQAGTVWVTVELPDGRRLSRRIANTSIAVGQTKNFRYKEFIPTNAPTGLYYVAPSFESSDRSVLYDFAETSFRLQAPPSVASLPTSTTASLEVSAPEAGPNPFSGETTIRYSLVEDADVQLSVYDVMGREVAALVSGTQNAGAQSAVFSGDDLPAGTYVWRLAIDGQVTTGRVTLAR